MPIVRASTSPLFTPHGATMTGLASPSRGSRELSVWRVRLHPGTTPEHSLDADEVFAILSGEAIFKSDGVDEAVFAGDTLIVPAGSTISFSIKEGQHLEAMCAMKAGGRATMAGSPSASFIPPWTL